MIKNIILGGAAILAMVAATPALADGAVTGAMGDGHQVGSLSTGSMDSNTSSNTASLNISINHTLSASSASGFTGTFNVGTGPYNAASLEGHGDAFAVAGGLGNLGALSPFHYEVTGAASHNDGSYLATTQNNASISGQVLNFAQASFNDSSSFTFASSHADAHNDTLTQNFSENFDGGGQFGTFGSDGKVNFLGFGN